MSQPSSPGEESARKAGRSEWGDDEEPWQAGPYCADINLYLNTNGRYVKALAFTTKIDPKPSCHDSAYSWVPSKSWTVVQSNVPNGRYFFFCFKPINTGVNTGASGYAAY